MSGCGITNLGSCLVEKLFEFILYLLNLPVKPLLAMINNLMVEPVNINIFAGIWAIIISMLSLFYGLFLLIVGFRFLISGNSPEQREKAKRSLTNIIIMMILIEISFFLYELVLQVASAMTSAIYGSIPTSFFQLTLGGFSNIGLELVLLIPYLMILVLTIIFLALRYICVGLGVILFAIGIFMYFIEPLNSYGRLIINYLGVLIFLPFIYAIILLASSKFLDIGIFSEMKIIVMIGGFALVNLITIFLLVFVIFKAASTVSGPAKQVATIVGAVA